MNEKLRNYYLPIKKTDINGIESSDMNVNIDKKEMYEMICRLILTPQFKRDLGNNLHVFKGKTDGYWKDIEPNNKKCMIISIDRGDFVRSNGVVGGDLAYIDILYNFKIVDGIDYKSNFDKHEILYMEV